MARDQDMLSRALETCAQINALSAWTEQQQRPQSRLVVSFDVYWTLVEYTVYMHALQGADEHTLEEYVRSDDLVYDTPRHRLDVHLDFFLPPQTFRLE